MAEGHYSEDPELRLLVLSNVRLTGKISGKIIGYGAHGSVREVTVAGAPGAAKSVRRDNVPRARVAEFVAELVAECKLMSTLRHPNIVQFLGVAFFPDESGLPALVMERLMTNLHDLLDPETDLSPPTEVSKQFFPLSLKCSILHNVACGVAFLHERSPSIVHGDLSARNVLLDSGMVAKISDLGVARTAMDTFTKAIGCRVYMPADAFSCPHQTYNSSLDVFSFGVITIFTVSEMFPFQPLASAYFDKNSGLLVARTELQRRSEYMRYVNEQLRVCGQLRGDHPLIRLIQQCLQNESSERPGIGEVLHLLEEAMRAGVRDGESERNEHELVRALDQTQPRNQVSVSLIIHG